MKGRGGNLLTNWNNVITGNASASTIFGTFAIAIATVAVAVSLPRRRQPALETPSRHRHFVHSLIHSCPAVKRARLARTRLVSVSKY